MLPTLQAATWCMQPWGPDAHREVTVSTTTAKDKQAQADGRLRLRMDPYRKTEGRLLSLHLIWEQFHKHLKDIPIAFLKIIKSGSIYGKYIPQWLSWKRIRLQCGRPGLGPWVGKIPWRREWLPTPVFWPGEFHGLSQRVGYN